jgi:HEAT repeat protein
MPLFGLPNVKKLEAKGDVPRLIKALGSHKTAVRIAAAEALGHVGDASAVQPLIVALKAWDVREAAVEALAHIGAEALEPLIAALSEGDRDVRIYAAGALGQIGETRAVEPLISALQDPGMLVRVAAAEALDRLGWKPDRAAA